MTAWERFEQKESGWYSVGYGQTDTITIGDKVINNYTWWLYILQLNGYILSYNEMKDEHTYNLN